MFLYSDLPDCEKNPVLLLGVNRVGTPNRTVPCEDRLDGKEEENQHHIHQIQSQQQKRPRPQTLVLDTNNQYDKDEVDKRSSLGVFYKDKSFYDIKSRPHRQSTKNNNNSSKKSNFYIELSPLDYYIDAACEANRNTIKIGQATSRSTQSSFENNSDRNSNGKTEEAFLQHISSFEINKNNKIHDRRENLTKKNSFEANDDTTTISIAIQQTSLSSPSIKRHQHHNKSQLPPTTKTSLSNQTTPKVLITRIKKTNHREHVENILIDQQPRPSSITTQHHQEHQHKQSTLSATPHHTSSSTSTKKKSSNCRIYGLIPKCAKRNDSTEPESLSEETNNNLDLLIRNNTLTIKSKNNSLIMDRSIDSIGSCSLDVDADSTDFSGTNNMIEFFLRNLTDN